MAVRRVRSQSPDDNFVPNKKRPRQTASKPKRRFAAISSEEVEAAKKLIVLKNTQKSTLWAVHVFMSWVEERNERGNKKCRIKVLCTSDMTELCHWLCVFVKEARCDDWQPYTPCNLTQLLSGIQRFINSKREPTELLVKASRYIKWSVPGTTERS